MRKSPLMIASPALCLSVLATLLMVPEGPSAQSGQDVFFVTGRNVNTLGPPPAPPAANPTLVGNPKHKQRNESSCDVSPYNPWVVLCANNDYRGIELFGDSWIGLSMSTDGSRTWHDRLLEGFPASPNGTGAADPIVRTVPGLGIVAYITLSRADSRGTLAMALLHERNKENGDPYQFYETRLIGTGTPGRFQDKPAMLVTLETPVDSSGNPVPASTIDVGGRPIPRGTVHYAYSLFPGNENNSASQIYYLSSKDYGLSWSSTRKLSESLGLNQGADIAADSANRTVVVVWRQVQDNNQPDGIVYAVSSNGGQSWSKPKPVWQSTVAGQFFDQDTTTTQFRTRAMPSIVHDGSGFHVFWSVRGFAAHPDDARVVVSSSADGSSWSDPVAVDPHPGRGHQIIPQSASAGGRIQVNWIDTRNNEPASFDRFIADYRITDDGVKVPLDAPNPSGGTKHWLYRQSGDIYGAQATAGAAVAFSSAQAVSRYRYGLVNGVRTQLEYNFLNARMFQKGMVPFNGDYHAVAGRRYRPSETVAGAWVRNTAPSTSDAIFYSAFTDNRDVEGYVWAGPGASPFTPAGGTQDGEVGTEDIVPCTPEPQSQARTVWTQHESPRSRYQNIYVAPSFPGLVVASPSGSKSTGTQLERAYVVFAQNLTGQDRVYRFAVAGQPPDAPTTLDPGGVGRASFSPAGLPDPAQSCAAGTDCRQIDVMIPRGSSATRTVYVRSTVPRPRILVNVTALAGDQNGSVIINSKPASVDIENPDSFEPLPDLSAGEQYQPDILQRQVSYYSTGVVNPEITPVTGVENPRLEYPRLEYPRLEYPRLEYPRLEYPRLEYDALGNPRLEYPRLEYPRLEYSTLQNPRLEYSALTGDGDGVITSTTEPQVVDVTWPVSTGVDSNTVTAMSSQVFINGTLPPACSSTVTTGCVQGAQLIVSVPHFYSVNRSCGGDTALIVENQVILNNVVSLSQLAGAGTGPDTVNPDSTQPTFFVGPKQVVFLTLRVVGQFNQQFATALASRSGLIVQSQPDTSVVDQSNDDIDVDQTGPSLDFSDLGFTSNVPVQGNTTGGANIYANVTASDDSGSASVSCLISNGTNLNVDGSATFVPLGSWTVTCTASDPSGNTTTSDPLTLDVVDTIPPAFNQSSLDALAASVTLTPSADGAILGYDAGVVSAADTVDPSVTIACEPGLTPAAPALPPGPAVITCTATDDSGNQATATYSLIVAIASTITTVSVADATYDGQPHGATAGVTGPGGLSEPLAVSYRGTGATSYGPTPMAPTDAGTYAATAAYAGTTGYEASSDTKYFAIARAATSVTVSCAEGPFTYTRAAQEPCTATVTGPAGLSDPLPVTYADNVNAGTATASASYAGSANYLDSGDSAAFSIGLAATSVSVTCDAGPFSYTGSAQTPCTAAVTGPGGLSEALTVTYADNVNVGTATASASYAGSANHLGSSGSATFSIGLAATSVSVTCEAGPFSYTGSAQTPCTAVVTGPGGLSEPLTVTYADNVNAGTATASASYGATGNYDSSSGSATFTIDVAVPTAIVTCPEGPFVYTGSPQTPCTASVTGPAGLNESVTPSYADNTNAGTATATAAYAGASNYAAVTGSATFTIGKAATSVAVTCAAGPFTYSGAAQTPCTATVTGPAGLSAPLAVTYTDNVSAGTATASASYVETPNYAASSNSASFTIGKAATSVSVTCSAGPFTYNGAPQTPCSASVAGGGGLAQALAVSYLNNVNVGTATASASYAESANHLASSGSASFAISKATPSFSGLSAPSIAYGTASTVLSGTILAGSAAPSGSVSITLNGITQAATIGAGGVFSATFATGTLSSVGSPYTITYAYAGDGNFFSAGPDGTKKLTVTPLYGLGSFSMQSMANLGSVVPVTWQYTLNGVAVDTGALVPVFRATKLTSCTASAVETGSFYENQQSPGNSNFQYSLSTFTWKYNWQTKLFTAGCYNIYIRLLSSAGALMQDNGPYRIQLKK